MQITTTFEPIRPIYAHEDGRAYYSDALQSLGQPRVYYGNYWWPSASHWLVPNTSTTID
jgi:hypothetical protein